MDAADEGGVQLAKDKIAIGSNWQSTIVVGTLYEV
jgi:hypothetical protein